MLRDLRFGVRAAWRSPGLAATAILLVALGAGANATIFAVARTVVYERLPFHDSDRLVALWREPLRGGADFGGSWPHLAELRGQPRLFQEAAGYLYSTSYSTGTHGDATSGPVADVRVTESFFALLGVRPFSGRSFSADEFLPDAAGSDLRPVAVSDGFWRERLGGSRDALGQPVTIGTWTGVVVAVLPPGFRLFRGEVPEVFSPFRDHPDHLADRTMTYLQIVARRQPGIGLEEVRTGLSAYSARTSREHPATDAGMSWMAEDLHARWFGPMRPVMTVLLLTVGCVLLIACANLAILFLVRAMGRDGEIAVRRALGAGGWDVARRFLAESVVLAACGGAAGVLVASWTTDLFGTLSLKLGLGLPAIHLDTSVVGFTLLVSTATGILFGAAPAIHAWRSDLAGSLKAGGATSRAGTASRRATSGLVVAEVAVSTLLLIGAGLLLRTFSRLNAVNPGFRPQQVTAVSIGQAPYAPRSRQRDVSFWSQLMDRSLALPGVSAVAICGSLPLATEQAPENMKAPITLEGRSLPAPGYLEAEYQDVSAGYFRAMGIPFRAGRTFVQPAEDELAVVVNESLAREAWGDADPIGQRLAMPGGRLHTVIGVVGDVKQYRLRSTRVIRQVYRPLWPSDLSTFRRWPSQYLVVRSSHASAATEWQLRGLVKSLDLARPVISARSLEEVALRSTAWDRLKAIIVGLFGATALLLSLVGMHAVLAHAVSRRRREIAIRVALGGQAADIRRMVLHRAMALVLAGLGIGIALASVTMPLVSDQLFEVTPLDVPTFGSVALLLGSAALAASGFPIRSATRTDPIAVLRAE